MPYDLILKNGTLVTHEKTFKADIALKDGKIARIGDCGAASKAVYDAEGLFILPGIIDAHTHFRDPGLTQKEDFETGSAAAAMGGITMIADMPNTIPPTSTARRFTDKVKIAKEKSFIDFALFALLTNENLNEMDEFKNAHPLGFKIFLGTSTGDIAAPDPETIIRQLEKSKKFGMRTGFHAETSEINEKSTNICKEKNPVPSGLSLSQARPVMSEALAIQNAISYAQSANAKIHIHHVTSIEGLRLIEKAKQDGLDITAEICPHYLLLDADSGAHKVYPPIRGGENRKLLWEALQNKKFDMIASDHAPHTAAEKSLPLWDAPAGLCGVETLVPLMLTEVNRGNLSLNDFVLLASYNPAKIWGIAGKKGSLLAGWDADFTVVDMNKKGKIDADKLHSKSKTSPYDGMEVQGMPVATIVRGEFIMKDGKLTGKKGYGILVSPEP
ncbi:MAG: dihydroorotase family protein [Treponema sp.]|nr:dihydroorotase family protein [Treponema sp.]